MENYRAENPMPDTWGQFQKRDDQIADEMERYELRDMQDPSWLDDHIHGSDDEVMDAEPDCPSDLDMHEGCLRGRGDLWHLCMLTPQTKEYE